MNSGPFIDRCQLLVDLRGDNMELRLAVIGHQFNLVNLALQHIQNRIKRSGRRRRRRRRVWVRPWISRRLNFGLYDQLLVELRNEDQGAFKNFMRMPPEMYDELLRRVGPRITKQNTKYRLPLDPGLKLAVTLRHLASGTKYSDMQYGWRVPDNTISVVVREVCQAIIDEYLDEVMTCPTTPEGWRAISDNFMKRWNFPNTCGALDGKHVACRCPPNSGSMYYNYKGFYSVVLLALVDADYKFIWADLGGLGSSSDAQIYNNCDLKEYVERDNIGFPRADALPNDTQDVPYYFIGDDAFALRETMMKPYGLRGLDDNHRIFNYRLSRARRVVENAFGILANRFQVVLGTMQLLPENVKLVTKTCICLHNLMRLRYPGLQNQQLDRVENNGVIIAGAWRDGRDMLDTQVVVGPNTATKKGKMQRNLLKHWVNSEAGAVPWQNSMI